MATSRLYCKNADQKRLQSRFHFFLFIIRIFTSRSYIGQPTGSFYVSKPQNIFLCGLLSNSDDSVEVRFNKEACTFWKSWIQSKSGLMSFGSDIQLELRSSRVRK